MLKLLSLLVGLVAVLTFVPAAKSSPPAQYKVFVDGSVIGSGDLVQVWNYGSAPLEVEVVKASNPQSILFSWIVPAMEMRRGLISQDVEVIGLSSDGTSDADAICFLDCFAGDTKVQTATGPRLISEISKGDQVLTGVGDRVATVAGVQRGLAPTLVSLDLGGEVLKVSRGHKLLTAKGGWIAAMDLLATDKLVRSSSEPVMIRSLSVKALAEPVPVYNLTLDNGRSFQVGAAGVQAEAMESARVEVR